jgi:hypothetical protein
MVKKFGEHGRLALDSLTRCNAFQFFLFAHSLLSELHGCADAILRRPR